MDRTPSARERELTEKGLRFVGSGVSGGEEGARFGPSLMPGGFGDLLGRDRTRLDRYRG